MTVIDRTKYETVTSVDRLDWYIYEATRRGWISFDTETTGLDFMEDELVGVALAVIPSVACYIPVGHIEGEQLPLQLVLERLKPVLEHPMVMKVMQNGKFDMNVMARYGVNLTNIEDTMLLSSSMYGGKHRHNMDELSHAYLGHQTLKYKEVAGNRPFSEVPLDLATKYSAEDADVTFRLPYGGDAIDGSSPTT